MKIKYDITHETMHMYQHICVLKIIPPVRSDLALTSNVPNIQLEASRLHTLDIKALKKGIADA